VLARPLLCAAGAASRAIGQTGGTKNRQGSQCPKIENRKMSVGFALFVAAAAGMKQGCEAIATFSDGRTETRECSMQV